MTYLHVLNLKLILLP